ncbi:phage holin family protein [Vulcaniibacterium tengchongense]|uniref:Membrane protein YqjE n=1 Tax=Vulcaniibacterium tengchongense TaxID=1273429 RepID=A0A3N4VAW8_9GAMM|nr:phage holin family protein [Vulcaniibacterium tengchongense]RPE79728.1 hypothetical protein EDC50_1554 [Vulcaniibacterium tengchongense]
MRQTRADADAEAPGADAARDEAASARAASPADLLEALREIRATGHASLGAAIDAGKALRYLLAADLALARSAAGRGLAFAGLAVAAGGSAWLLLMAALVALLSRVGLSWLSAMLIAAGLSLVATALAGWRALRYFEYTRLQATRRQLARLGLGELADFMPPPDAPQPGREAAEALREAARKAPPKDPTGGDIVPP